MKRLHLIIFSISAGLIAAGTLMSAILYSKMPESIPVRFDLYSDPIGWAEKSLSVVFLLPLISIVIFLLFALIYRRPEFSSWPTTLVLIAVEEKKRAPIFKILRSMIAWTLLSLTFLFTYLQFLLVSTANQRTPQLSTHIMLALLLLIVITIIVTNVRMIKAVYKVAKS